MQSTMTNDVDVRTKAQDTASTLVDQAQQVATTQVATQQERFASTLDSVAESLRQTGSSMRDGQPQIAGLTDEAARRVESASNYLREHDLNDLIRETERFARREPLMFLGAAFAIGFIGARFLKTSAPDRPIQPQAGYRQIGSDYGQAWNTRSTGANAASSLYAEDYTGASEPTSTAAYGASDTTYHASAPDYDINGNSGMRGVGSDLEPSTDEEATDDVDTFDEGSER
jgi:ElaB/YqjD/DUF883 family membrane-anchored ribosome-binding protein